MQTLLSASADVNAKDNDGKTPLHYASSEWDCDVDKVVDVAQILLSAGADLNANNNNGETPLHSAVYHLNSNIVQTLVSAAQIYMLKPKKAKLPCILQPLWIQIAMLMKL